MYIDGNVIKNVVIEHDQITLLGVVMVAPSESDKTTEYVMCGLRAHIVHGLRAHNLLYTLYEHILKQHYLTLL